MTGQPTQDHPQASANSPQQPPYSPVPGTDQDVQDVATFQQSASASPLSHVTSRPESVEGHNFDPRIRSQYANEPKVVHAPRPHEPKQHEISEEVQKRHKESVEKYPFLNLTAGEYVVLELQRHPIGLWMPIGLSCFLIILLLSVLFSYPMMMLDSGSDMLPGLGLVALMTLSLSVLIGIFAYISAWVYLGNQFFLTNESVIQELQYSLFSKREQTASLGSIEDVSFLQTGVLQTMLNYGTIRLSTEGDETTYRFHFVSDPKAQTRHLTNAVEAFKNGRPVES